MIEKPGGSPFEKYSKALGRRDPGELAGLSGGRWEAAEEGRGTLEVPVLQGSVRVEFPEIRAQGSPGLDSFTIKLLTLIYLATTDGTPPSRQWAAYRDLPDGRFYEPVLIRSVEEPLAARFGGNPEAFDEAAESAGGRAEEHGDRAYSFRFFPLLPICIVLWEADEEFPARCRCLFDRNSCRHLGAFDLRMAAEEVSKRLVPAGS